ncbi:MAG: UDP-2,3-diacylglucosamine diphosphatase [Gammaproteobacteria bacterium]|nr:MAG: UDP-2,3-diacylglucosamine diphosphatase [Gammaproteobacteria bacterium]
MYPLFVSDLHLDDGRPELTAAFLAFLSGEAREAAELYILGDLFELWLGDDAASPSAREVMAALRAFTDAGHRCRFLHGNRDFLIGAEFARVTGIELLPGPQIVDIGGEATLLMHGDELCTDDVGYQRLRRILRRPGLQRSFLALPRTLRQRFADWLRRRSRRSQRAKSPEIMDVNQAAVRRTMQHFRVAQLIHGHTHRPGIHAVALDGRQGRRIVLGDWHAQGSVLRWRDGEPRLETLG